MNDSNARRFRRSLSILAVLITTAAVTLGPGIGRHGAATVPSVLAQADGAEHDAVSVHIVEVESSRGARPDVLRASGTLQPARHAPIAFPVAGVVLEVAHDEGDAVAAGDVLARLDPVPFESAVARARASVDYLEKSTERSRLLKDQRALSEEEFDAQTAELDGARAQLRLARWNLERSALRAPFAGFVLARHVELGQVVGGGTPSYEIIELATLEVEAALAASDLTRIDLDGIVTLTVRDDPRLHATGRIEHAPVRSDARSGSVPLRVKVDNGAGHLLPGMVVEASFTVRAAASGEELLVPLTAVRLDDLGAAVWRVDGAGRVERVEVELGPVRNDRVVVEGLRVGDRIVDEAPDRLRDGDSVIARTEQEER